jgi:3-phosphoshikimate 1-carboxyvinyltransferase
MTSARFEPSGPLSGSTATAADKSLSHRAALFAAMATGRSTIHGYLRAADTDRTLAVIEQLGAGVEIEGGTVAIDGIGLDGPAACDGVVDVGNSGTLMRLLAGWLSGCEGREWEVDGDASIRTRPIDRVSQPLSRMGARIESVNGCAPFRVEGSSLTGIDERLVVASAQVKSAILLAGLQAEGPTRIVEQPASRDHTERMLVEQGVDLSLETLDDGATAITLQPGGELSAVDRQIPGDPSSAAFLAAAALLVPDSKITITGVDVNPGRIGLFRVLERMGAKIDGLPEGETDPLGREPVADVTFAHGDLRATEIQADEVPSMIDELPLFALIACFADGTSTVTGASELRVKESDRISGVVAGLSGLGARIEELEDGFRIEGTGTLPGGVIDSLTDHRLAMLGAVAGLASTAGVTVNGFDAVSVSYPQFASDIGSLT